MISNYQEKQRISQLKKGYAVISQAFQYLISENGSVSNLGLPETDTGKYDENNKIILNHQGQYILKEELKKYLKTVKYNRKDDKQATTLDGQDFIIGYDTEPLSIQTIDGTVYEIGYIHNCNPSCGDLWIWLPDSKHILGKTYFGFQIRNNGIIPYGEKESQFNTWCNKDDKSQSLYMRGKYCTAWALRHGNMDYSR